MGSIDGEIPAVWFLISSIGFIILTIIQYRNTGKSFNTIFLGERVGFRRWSAVIIGFIGATKAKVNAFANEITEIA